MAQEYVGTDYMGRSFSSSYFINRKINQIFQNFDCFPRLIQSKKLQVTDMITIMGVTMVMDSTLATATPTMATTTVILVH